jgi:hypothetical protein
VSKVVMGYLNYCFFVVCTLPAFKRFCHHVHAIVKQ